MMMYFIIAYLIGAIVCLSLELAYLVLFGLEDGPDAMTIGEEIFYGLLAAILWPITFLSVLWEGLNK